MRIKSQLRGLGWRSFIHLRKNNMKMNCFKMQDKKDGQLGCSEVTGNQNNLILGPDLDFKCSPYCKLR